MKVKELVRQLMEADPSGEEECCVGNTDIHFISNDPAFYDGKLQVLTRDESKKEYNITGGKYVSSGRKISIHTLSISDAIISNPSFPVDYSNCGNSNEKAYKEHDDKTRKMAMDIEKESELRLFHKWTKKTAAEITGNRDYLLLTATDFFEKHLSASNLLPTEANNSTSHQSYDDRRFAQWDLMIEIKFDGMDWDFTLKNDKQS